MYYSDVLSTEDKSAEYEKFYSDYRKSICQIYFWKSMLNLYRDLCMVK